jgi:hypothetical protein
METRKLRKSEVAPGVYRITCRKNEKIQGKVVVEKSGVTKYEIQDKPQKLSTPKIRRRLLKEYSWELVGDVG